MEKEPNWDLKLRAPGTAFKILLLSSSLETAARALAGRIFQEKPTEEEVWRKRPHLVLGERTWCSRDGSSEPLVNFFLCP